jgi:hypothetical protein
MMSRPSLHDRSIKHAAKCYLLPQELSRPIEPWFARQSR